MTRASVGAMAAVVTLLSACGSKPPKPPITATSRSPRHPTSSPARAVATSAPLTRRLQLQLYDGKPVINAPLKLRCDGTTRRARTDQLGYVRIPSVRKVVCKLWLGAYWLTLPKRAPTLRLPSQLEVELTELSTPWRLRLDSRIATVHAHHWQGRALTLRGDGVLDGGLRTETAPRSPGTSRPDNPFAAFARARARVLAIGHREIDAQLDRQSRRSPVLRRLLRSTRIYFNRDALLHPPHGAAGAFPSGHVGPPLLRAQTQLRRASREIDALLASCKTSPYRHPLAARSNTGAKLVARVSALVKQLTTLAKSKRPRVSLLAMAESVSAAAGVHCRCPPRLASAAVTSSRPVRPRRASSTSRVHRLLNEPPGEPKDSSVTSARRLLTKTLLKRELALRTVAAPLAARLRAAAGVPSNLGKAARQLEHEQRRLLAARAKRRRGHSTLSVTTLRRRAVLPVGLRGAPRGGEAVGVPLRTGAGRHKLSSLLGQRRTLLVISACHHDRRWLKALSKLAIDYRHIGLAVGAAAVRACKGPNEARGYWLAGPLLPWALEVQPDSVVVLDDKGVVLWRQKLASISHAADAASAWLADNWPAFARAQRRGALPPAAALAARLQRLHRQLVVLRAKRKWGRALKLAKRAAKLAPGRPELQRRVAVMAGHARDLAEVARRSRWWRKRYGDLSSEVLLDHVREKTGVPTLPDPGRKTGAIKRPRSVSRP